ncbi:hypothetical protein RRG08_065915 [Elysia crispata]|uniref:Uncharacterized protein n=1 Tax=Elysia crispata TaxID=231223 RepID=A0AAE0YVN1_9GAST|nr:hypothetical protein RRG08_065915 [Elysia crispata]
MDCFFSRWAANLDQLLLGVNNGGLLTLPDSPESDQKTRRLLVRPVNQALALLFPISALFSQSRDLKSKNKKTNLRDSQNQRAQQVRCVVLYIKSSWAWHSYHSRYINVWKEIAKARPNSKKSPHQH